MADVYSVFGALLALGIAFPGLLTGAWLVFPGAVGRARLRVSGTPWRSLLIGLAAVVLTVAVVAILNAVPLGLFKMLGLLTVFVALGVATLGAASIAAEMGDQLRAQMGPSVSPAGAFVRGAVALELAAVFPLVGWFLVIPGVLLVGYGAGIASLLHWLPRPKTTSSSEALAGAA
jgi:hypothetical protein